MEPRLLALFLLTTISIDLAVAAFAWQWRKQQGARLLVAFALAAALLSAAHGGELVRNTLTGKVAMHQAFLLATALVAPLALLMAIWYAGFSSWISARRTAIVFTPALILLAVILTNEGHHLYVHNFTVGISQPSALLDSTPGPIYWAGPLLIAGYFALSALVIVQSWHHTSAPRLVQTLLLLCCMVAPAVAVGLEFLELDLAGFVLSLSLATAGLLYLWSLAIDQVNDRTPDSHELALSLIDTGILIVDAERRIVDINAAACTFLSLKHDDTVGAVLDDILHPWPRLIETIDADPAVLNREVVLQVEGAIRCLWVTCRSLPAKVDANLTSMVISLFDATSHRADDLARLDQQRWLVVAEERERLARDLHDGVSQVLGYASTQAQAAREYLHGGQYQMADAALAHLTTVVQEAHTDVRNLILGAQFGETLPGDFVEAVTYYVSRFEKRYDQPVRLTINAVVRENWLTTDAQTQLLHVIREALTNARKHAQATTIEVYCRVEDNLVEVTISDNGIGFDMELIDSASHFGLEVMRTRMEEAGGVLKVQSTKGSGARISAKLTRPTAPPTADDLLSRLKIVIADDQPLFRDGLHNLLAARGIAVIGLAADGAEAVQRTLDLQPDVVIMDIHMPVLDGLEATEQIKRTQPAVKVLILTVVENEATLVDALRRGASGYLLKTLDAQTLFAMLEQLARGETVLTPAMATHLVGTFMASDELDLSVRHQEILRLMAQGYTYRQIAAKIHLSESAVKYNAGQIIDRLHARTRAEAVRLAEKRGII